MSDNNSGVVFKEKLIDNNNFDKLYADWKRWDIKGFGNLSKQRRVYYDAEMKKTKKPLKKIKVLEVGFGKGEFLAYARERGWDVAGTEMNSFLVEAAKSQYFEVFNVENLQRFADSTFDMVVAFDVLEHMQKKEIASFLAETSRILRSGGVFLARFPNGDSPIGMINQNGDITHETLIGSNKARYFAKLAKAQIIYLGGAAQPVFAGNWLYSIHRIFTFPIKYTINLFVNLVFFPLFHIDFCSRDLVMILLFDKSQLN